MWGQTISTITQKTLFPLRESVDTEFRSLQAEVIKKRRYSPYSLTLQEIKTKMSRKSDETLTAQFSMSGSNGYFFESFENAYASDLPNGWTIIASTANANHIALH